jgi:hypothetical protein
MPHSDHIIYADESGDHGLESIDSSYPVFVLAFCIVKKMDYSRTVVSSLTDLKFKYFGHDMVIFHSREIRKSAGDFTILQNGGVRTAFLTDLSGFVAASPFTLVAAIIDKANLIQQYIHPSNPYELAMRFCLERSYAFLRDKGDAQRTTHLVCESRGKKEDDELELEFRRICAGSNKWGVLPFDLVFAGKACNSPGLQLADLVAYPIGRAVVSGSEASPAYQALLPKFRTSPWGKVDVWGRKVFP